MYQCRAYTLWLICCFKEKLSSVHDCACTLLQDRLSILPDRLDLLRWQSKRR